VPSISCSARAKTTVETAKFWLVAVLDPKWMQEENVTSTTVRRLYLPSELPEILRLTPEQIDHLVRTGQLRPIRICGEDRFDSRELDALIETYKQISSRRHSYVQ